MKLFMPSDTISNLVHDDFLNKNSPIFQDNSSVYSTTHLIWGILHWYHVKEYLTMYRRRRYDKLFQYVQKWFQAADWPLALSYLFLMPQLNIVMTHAPFILINVATLSYLLKARYYYNAFQYFYREWYRMHHSNWCVRHDAIVKRHRKKEYARRKT